MPKTVRASHMLNHILKQEDIDRFAKRPGKLGCRNSRDNSVLHRFRHVNGGKLDSKAIKPPREQIRDDDTSATADFENASGGGTKPVKLIFNDAISGLLPIVALNTGRVCKGKLDAGKPRSGRARRSKPYTALPGI